MRNPHLGPGWPAVGSERFAPFDVANVGDIGALKSGGITPVNGTLLDERCAFFKDIYPLLEQYVLE